MHILRRSRLFATLIAAGLALYAQVAAAPFAPQVGALAVQGHYVEGEVLVKFRATTGVHQRLAAMAVHGHALLASLGQTGWARVGVARGQTTAGALAAYRGDPGIESVQPNYVYHTLAAPNDPDYAQLWAFRNTGQTIHGAGSYPPTSGNAGDDMDIEPAWDHVTDCSSVLVAVLDTGVNYRHEDLAANMWDGGSAYPNHGWNFVDGNDDPMDLDGHGTHVAGIIGASGNNGQGTTGVCWKASIMAVRIGDALGQLTTAWIIQGLDFAVAQHAKVINMSFGGDAFDQATSDAITRAQDADVVLVAAAGNETADNERIPLYPCNFTQPNLICVAALGPDYALAGFSNWGASSVDVGAPGTNILSTYAGSVATLDDALSDWTISGGWQHTMARSNSDLFDVLLDPADFGRSRYAAGLRDTATKVFSLQPAASVVVHVFGQIALAAADDSFTLAAAPDGTDPFGPEGVNFSVSGPFHSGTAMTPIGLDISRCAAQGTCRISTQLATGAGTPGDWGVALAGFSIQALTLSSDAYQLDNGTSMATPEVVGVAALLRAYNPQYSYADTIQAIELGGRPIPALAGRTSSGRAVDVMASLAYINPPVGLSASVR